MQPARPRPPAIVFATLALGLVSVGCGASLPARMVVEQDIGGWAFRRYQRVLDVELAIEGNPAESSAATYVRHRGDAIAIATAVVTRYEQATAVAAEVKDLLDGLGTYEVRVVDQEGGRMFDLRGGAGDRWVLWVSGRHVVKIGAPEGDAHVPRSLIRAYIDPFPSDLDEHGRAKPGADSAGLSRRQREERESDMDLPPSLREERAEPAPDEATP